MAKSCRRRSRKSPKKSRKSRSPKRRSCRRKSPKRSRKSRSRKRRSPSCSRYRHSKVAVCQAATREVCDANADDCQWTKRGCRARPKCKCDVCVAFRESKAKSAVHVPHSSSHSSSSSSHAASSSSIPSSLRLDVMDF